MAFYGHDEGEFLRSKLAITQNTAANVGQNLQAMGNIGTAIDQKVKQTNEISLARSARKTLADLINVAAKHDPGIGRDVTKAGAGSSPNAYDKIPSPEQAIKGGMTAKEYADQLSVHIDALADKLVSDGVSPDELDNIMGMPGWSSSARKKFEAAQTQQQVTGAAGRAAGPNYDAAMGHANARLTAGGEPGDEPFDMSLRTPQEQQRLQGIAARREADQPGVAPPQTQEDYQQRFAQEQLPSDVTQKDVEANPQYRAQVAGRQSAAQHALTEQRQQKANLTRSSTDWKRELEQMKQELAQQKVDVQDSQWRQGQQIRLNEHENELDTQVLKLKREARELEKANRKDEFGMEIGPNYEEALAVKNEISKLEAMKEDLRQLRSGLSTPTRERSSQMTRPAGRAGGAEPAPAPAPQQPLSAPVGPPPQPTMTRRGDTTAAPTIPKEQFAPTPNDSAAKAVQIRRRMEELGHTPAQIDGYLRDKGLL